MQIVLNFWGKYTYQSAKENKSCVLYQVKPNVWVIVIISKGPYD